MHTLGNLLKIFYLKDFTCAKPLNDDAHELYVKKNVNV